MIVCRRLVENRCSFRFLRVFILLRSDILCLVKDKALHLDSVIGFEVVEQVLVIPTFSGVVGLE